MFTGIVKELGIVRNITKAGPVYRLGIESKDIARTLKTGDSVSVNGVCLTLVGKEGGVLSFDVMEETVRRTNLAGLKNRDYVNLEGSLKAGDSFGGHFVLGHVDCLGRIKDIKKSGGDFVMTVEIPPDFANLIVEKGSVAIDGVSLTIGEARSDRFKVYLIPHTLKITTLGLKNAGYKLNIEFDILGKYIARLKDVGKSSKVTENFLKENGF